MSAPLSIALAEDDKFCREFITEALEQFGAKVHGMSTLGQLWKIIALYEVDAIWLDLVLDDAAADETLEALPLIRARLPKTTIIVVSGWEDAHRERALRLGADAYSGKQELGNFKTSVVARLLSKAATAALNRGANPSMILEKVASFVGEVVANPPNQFS